MPRPRLGLFCSWFFLAARSGATASGSSTTIVITDSAQRTASAALAPRTWKPCSWWRTPPASRQSPTIPLAVIMTAATTTSMSTPAAKARTTGWGSTTASASTATAAAGMLNVHAGLVFVMRGRNPVDVGKSHL